jgi:hypothetical protein
MVGVCAVDIGRESFRRTDREIGLDAAHLHLVRIGQITTKRRIVVVADERLIVLDDRPEAGDVERRLTVPELRLHADLEMIDLFRIDLRKLRLGNAAHDRHAVKIQSARFEGVGVGGVQQHIVDRFVGRGEIVRQIPFAIGFIRERLRRQRGALLDLARGSAGCGHEIALTVPYDADIAAYLVVIIDTDTR